MSDGGGRAQPLWLMTLPSIGTGTRHRCSPRFELSSRVAGKREILLAHFPVFV